MDYVRLGSAGLLSDERYRTDADFDVVDRLAADRALPRPRSRWPG